MDNMADLIFSLAFLESVIRVTTPILFATMAVLISEKAGVLNIGVEGTMLMAALMGVVGSAYTQSAWLGLLIAVCTGVLYAGILAFCHLKLNTDVFLSGIALNLMASGLTVSILYLLTGDKGVSSGLPGKTLPNVEIPLIRDIPYLGDVLSGQNALTYLAVLTLILLSFFLNRTRTGKYIRAVGQAPGAVATAGISVKKIKMIALLISGGLAGMGGAFMSMAYLSMFTRDMIAGRGFIAIAAEAMGRGLPGLSLLASTLFGFADALASNLQLFNIPGELTRLMPYLLTILALTIYAAQKTRKDKTLR